MKSLLQWKVSLDPYNSRAPEMWALISNGVDFENKSVLDLGCGGGDMLIMSYYAGASKIKGIDKDKRMISFVRKRIEQKIGKSNILLSIDNIEKISFENWDIMICFSVLPYLQDPGALLQKMQLRSRISLVETQYYGEPYCLGYIKNDKDMREWLLGFGWNSVTNLGCTNVDIRNTTRTIWRCKNA